MDRARALTPGGFVWAEANTEVRKTSAEKSRAFAETALDFP
jgi:hypothetical protein